MQEIDLHNNNQLIRAKVCMSSTRPFFINLLNFVGQVEWLNGTSENMQIAENERKQQNMNLMPGGGDYEMMQPQPFDNRNYFQVNALQPTNHYPHQDQMALQLV